MGDMSSGGHVMTETRLNQGEVGPVAEGGPTPAFARTKFPRRGGWKIQLRARCCHSEWLWSWLLVRAVVEPHSPLVVNQVSCHGRDAIAVVRTGVHGGQRQ